jgi:hypothetical protein
MARPERFELPTYSSGGCRSIQLSYGRVNSVYIKRRLGRTRPGIRSNPTQRELPAISTTAAAAFAPSTTTTTTGAAIGLWPRLVHVECASTHL